MEIHISVVAHSLAEDLIRLFDSVDVPVTWHLFRHSQYPDVIEACEHLTSQYTVQYYPYGENRGLAKSWNEGIANSYAMGADVVMIANDDAVIGPGDTMKIAQASLDHPEYFMTGGAGFDISQMRHLSDMRLTLSTVNPIAIEQIGYFDEQISPVYFEDCDYYRRAKLLGLKSYAVPDTMLIHAGSKTNRSNEALRKQHAVTFARNRNYYQWKWGGLNDHEVYTTPFNDPRLGLRIDEADRHNPYPGYERSDLTIIKI